VKVEVAEKYRCKECSKPADFRFYSEYFRYKPTPHQATSRTKVLAIPLGSRFQCEHGHSWQVPGWTSIDMIGDPEAKPLHEYSLELDRKSRELDAHLKEMGPVESGDPGLRLLFQIQEVLPEALIASGFHLGAAILLQEFKEQKQRIDQLYEALEKAHSVDRCPYSACGGCNPCIVIEVERKRRKG